MNKSILIGNVGADPKITTFDNGGMVAQFSLATTERGFKTKDGKEIPAITDWHYIVAGNGFAKVVQQYVHKGDKLYIEGLIRRRTYGENNKKHITEIHITAMEMLGSPKGKAEAAPAPQPDAVATPSEQPAAAPTGDDLPF